jgi:hypothetical protein
MKIKILSIVLVIVVFLTACSPSEFVLSPEDPAVVAQGGGVVSVPYIDNSSLGSELKEAIIGSIRDCPLEDLPANIKFYFKLPIETTMRICDGYSDIGFASLMVAGVMEIPATLEPGIAGEATQGVVLIGGKVVAWLFIAGAVVLESAVLVRQVPPIEDLILAASSEGLTRPGPEWDLPSVPQEAIDSLVREGSHALTKHAIARCIISVLRSRQAPVRVYFSLEAPGKRMFQPSLGFSWYLDKVLRDMGENLGDCAGIDTQLMAEYDGRVPKYSSVRLFLVVGLGSNGKYFTFSAYPILEDLLNTQLCEWGYKTQLYPQLKRVNCPAGY